MSEPGVINLAVLLSGSGTNFQSIIDSIEQGMIPARIAFAASNKKDAYGLERARKHHIPAFHISKKTEGSFEMVDRKLYSLISEYDVDLLCLAGYLKKVSPWLVERLPNRIMNIHPGLLPFLGGKGMYGHHVHERVIELGMKVSGVTIHFVDEHYDNGPIIAQKCVPVEDGDDADSLAKRVLKTEHELYPRVIRWFAEGRLECRSGKVRINDY